MLNQRIYQDRQLFYRKKAKQGNQSLKFSQIDLKTSMVLQLANLILNQEASQRISYYLVEFKNEIQGL